MAPSWIIQQICQYLTSVLSLEAIAELCGGPDTSESDISRRHVRCQLYRTSSQASQWLNTDQPKVSSCIWESTPAQ